MSLTRCPHGSRISVPSRFPFRALHAVQLDFPMSLSALTIHDYFIEGQPTPTPFGFHSRPTGTSCGAQQYVCKNLKCVDKAQICNFKNDCGDNSDEIPCGSNCTFEDDCWRGWRQSTGTDNFNWRRKNGQTPSVGTGPTNDHTLGTAQVH